MKVCSKCKKTKPLEEFTKKSSSKDGYCRVCKTCSRQYCKNHYVKNKKYYVNKARKYSNEIKEWIKTLKSKTPCKDCKTLYPYYVMDFDHLHDKKFNINEAYLCRGKKELEKEIAKCEVVCANCHRERTHKRNNFKGA